MEDARIRAFSRLVGSKIQTLILPMVASAALFAASGTAQATPICQNLGATDPMTAGDDTCKITSPQSGPLDALGNGTVGDTLQLDGTGGSFSFDTSTITAGGFVNFENAAVLGPVTLTGVNTGALSWTVTSGTLTIANSNALNAATSVTVASAGTITATVSYATNVLVNHGFVEGNATFNGTLTLAAVTNDGTLAPGVGVGNIGTMTVAGNYTTEVLAHANMDVNLVTGASDFIHVTGSTGGGTLIAINPTNVSPGIATTGNGILLWRIEGSGAINQFGLAAPVVSTNTPYQYLLNYVTDYSGPSDGLFLKSALRQEFYGDAALLSGEQATIRTCFRSDQRIPDSPRGRENVRAWTDLKTASFKTDVQSGIKMDEKMNCVTGGIDLGLGEGIRFGVVGGYGGSSINVTTPGGIGTLDGTTTAVEGLFSMGTPQYFFNVTAGYATTDWTFDGPAPLSIDATHGATQKGVIGSAEAGTTVNLTPFRFKFIAAVNYDHTSCGNNCLLNGTTESTGILDAKGTIRVEAMTHQINPYVAVSFSDDLSKGDTVSFGSQTLTADTGHNLLTLNAGFNAPVDEGVLVFGDASVLDGMGNTGTTGYSIAGGLKAYW